MSVPTDVPVFDLAMFDGVDFSLAFNAELYDANGVPTGTFYDFTGKTLAVIFSDIFPEKIFTLLSSDPVTPLGSQIQITAPPTAGDFTLYLSATEMATVTKKNGYYRIEVREGANSINLLCLGSVRIIPLTGDGSLQT